LTRWTGEAPQGLPFWWAGGVASSDPAELPEQADILVIGAGYTGLSAAIAAHDAGAKVTVVDAGEPGQAASTRNGGMFGAHPRLGWDALAKAYGADVADAIFAEANPALTFVKGLIAREGIDCDLANTGRIQLAWTEAHFENQKRVVGHLQEKTDVEARLVEKSDLEAEINTAQYFGGFVLPQHCGIDPRKFHDGLWAAARRRAIPIVANCAVTGWQETRTGYRVETARGEIRAEKLVLATNGYTPKAFAWHKQRVFPLPSFIIATEPLDPELISYLAPGRRMMVETRARHSYWRVSPDGSRILWGGRAAMRPLNLAVAVARLQATMAQVWPSLANVALSHVWTGNTGYSFGHMPHVGKWRGVHYAMGFSGSGTVMASYLGAKAGLQAVGSPDGETAYSSTRLSFNWLNPTGTPWFLYAADAWYHQWVDRREWALRKH
jgi:glycine/D-amino acid oxidase-like deaminating enzyme